MIEHVPPALVPVVVAVVAAVVGGLLWRLFKLALKLVLLVVFVIVVVGVIAWKNPALVGIVTDGANDALTEETAPTKTTPRPPPKLEAKPQKPGASRGP